MSFTLPPISDFKIDKTGIVEGTKSSIDKGIFVVDSADDVKYFMFLGVYNGQIHPQLRDILAPHYQTAVDVADMLGDDKDEAVKAVFGMSGDLEDIVAQRALVYKPSAGDEGKWLAKFGFVAADWEKLASVEPDKNEMPDIPEQFKRTEVTPVPRPPAPPITTLYEDATALAAQNAPPAKEPDKSDLTTAYAAWFAAASFDAQFMSEQVVKVSKSTLLNWTSGRSAPKCSTEQAKALVADIDRRVALLIEAASVFSAVR